MKAIAILIDPTGKRFYVAYGLMVTRKHKAMRFLNHDVAEGAALERLGRGHEGFWESERRQVKANAVRYRDWTYKIEVQWNR